jgi:hypothetical protein
MEDQVGAKPSKNTPKDQRLKRNNPNAGAKKPAMPRPPAFTKKKV